MIYIIGLTGRKRSGKDSAANFLAMWYGAKHVKIAAPLKGTFYMTDPFAFTPAVAVLSRMKLQHGGDAIKAFSNNPNIFVDIAIAYIKSDIKQYKETVDPILPIEQDPFHRYYVISDVRFQHEVERLRQEFGDSFYLLKLEREGYSEPDYHASEVECDTMKPDYTVKAGSLYELYEQLIDFMSQFNDIIFPNRPKVYLSRNITSAEQHHDEIARVISEELTKLGFKCMTPTATVEEYWQDMVKKGVIPAANLITIHDMEWLASAHAVFFSVHTPSIGCAIELFYAAQMGKPFVVYTTDTRVFTHPFIQTFAADRCFMSITDAIEQFKTLTGVDVVRYHIEKRGDR